MCRPTWRRTTTPFLVHRRGGRLGSALSAPRSVSGLLRSSGSVRHGLPAGVLLPAIGRSRSPRPPGVHSPSVPRSTDGVPDFQENAWMVHGMMLKRPNHLGRCC